MYAEFNSVLDSPILVQRMENVATYSEARSEYTKQLATFIVPSLVGWFQTLWARNATDKQRCLTLFQTECEEVARWNQDRVHDEVHVLLEKCGCDYMEDLMTAVFIAHTKVLTAVRLSKKQKKLAITVPKLDHFIHRVFRESARFFWKSPFLFMTDNGVMERQKNVLQIESLTSEAITSAVRGLLPVKQILQDYLGEDEEDEEVESASPDVTAVPIVSSVAPASPESGPRIEESKEDVGEKVVAPAAIPVETKVEAPAALATSTTPAAAETADPKAKVPDVVNIDTEQTVHFSSYDDVFDEAKGAPEIRFAPKDGDLEEDSDSLKVDESSAKALGDEDVVDLDAPPKPVAAPVVASPPKKEVIGDDEVEVLE
jgi:hypothetical protein